MFSERLDFAPHTTIELQGISKSVEAFIVNPRGETIGSNSSISGGDNSDNEDIEEL